MFMNGILHFVLGSVTALTWELCQVGQQENIYEKDVNTLKRSAIAMHRMVFDRRITDLRQTRKS